VTVYALFSWALVTILAVTLLWPLNVPAAALAYKVRQGDRPVPFEPRAFWMRSAFAALGLAVLSLVALGLAYVLIQSAEFPAGPVHLVLVLAYVPLGVWYMFLMFAMDDLLEGLSLFLLYILLPGLPLLLLGWLFGLPRVLAERAPWLVSTPL
jgi:hypothetical protein